MRTSMTKIFLADLRYEIHQRINPAAMGLQLPLAISLHLGCNYILFIPHPAGVFGRTRPAGG